MGLTRPRAHQLQDIDYKQTSRAITTTNITLSGGAPATVDGVSLGLNDRVLVTGQSTGSENGIYSVTTVGAGSNGTWARSSDADAAGEIKAGSIIMVTEGTVNADTQWKLTTDDPITIGQTALTFARNGNNAYGVFAVAGQSDIVADGVGDTLTVVAGTNIALTTNASADTLTITPSLTPAVTTLEATGNITGGNLITAGSITASGLVYPTADGTSGQAIITDASGNLSFGDVSGGGGNWQSVVTASTLTVVAGNGYPINTTSNACTVTLPSSASVGDSISIVDYAGTFATNSITLTSSLNIEGATDDKKLRTNREGVTITYVDATQGWVATSGVNSGTQALDPSAYDIEFLVVAGGGGTGSGGGGAGGLRTSTQSTSVGTVITVAVGDGGAGAVPSSTGSIGSNSSISGSGLTTITSAGGGGGGGGATSGASGGSGGGTGYDGNGAAGGTGNTPSTSPSQGNNGGAGVGTDLKGGAGGGGAGAAGLSNSGSAGGNGGIGSISTIISTTLASSLLVGVVSGSDVYFAGGGGGGCNTHGGGTGGTGGTGGGGAGGASDGANGVSGLVNTGGGAGGREPNSGGTAPSGGKGVVILKLPTTFYSGTISGSPTVSTSGTDTILTFKGTGSYTS